jgi:hypothetical protein
MKVLSVLNARADGAASTTSGYPVTGYDWWPESVTAITLVITMPDDGSDRFVAHAVDADGEGRELYSVVDSVDRLGPLVAAFWDAVGKRIRASTTPLLPSSPPPRPGPPGDPPNLAVIAIAKIHQEVISRVQPLAPDLVMGRPI